MNYYFSIWWNYVLQNIKVVLTYRVNFIISFFATLIYVVVNLSFIWIIFENIPILAGWNFYEVIFMFGIGEITFGIFAVIGQNFTNNLPANIIDGQLDRTLLRPINPFLQQLIENFNLNDIVIIFKGLVLISFAVLNLDFEIGIQEIFIFFVAILSGSFTYLGIFITTSSLSFWLKDRRGLLDPLYVMNNFSRWPLNIYPKIIRFFMTWILPFAFVAFYPTNLILGKEDFVNISLFAPLIAIFSFYFAFFIYSKGIRKYESTGT